MIKQMQVKNFKILQDIEISNFSKMNIFVGNNDCGKTSLLEAIYLLLSWGKTPALIHINLFRSARLDNTNKQCMFYNFNTDSTISLNANIQDIPININIKYYKDYVSMNLDKMREKSIEHTQNDMFEEKLKTIVVVNAEKYESTLKFNDKVIEQNASIEHHPLASFIGSNIDTSHLTKIIMNMRRSKKMQYFVEHFHKFNSSIKDIEIDGKDIYVNLSNLSELLDIKFMGGGFKKFLAILSILFDNSDTDRFFIYVLMRLKMDCIFPHVKNYWKFL